jgi:hypothetical protein
VDVDVVATGERAVFKCVVVSYISTFKANASTESFITPAIALEIVDYVHFNKYRCPIASDVSG